MAQVVPWSISIKHHIRGPTDPDEPTLFLESVRLKLKGNTVVRARSLFSEPEDNGSITVATAEVAGLDLPLPLNNTRVTYLDSFGLAKMQPGKQGERHVVAQRLPY